MSREEKALMVSTIEKLFNESSIGILTDYRGITAPDITVLRRKLDESGIKFRVVKNTLARIAAERAGRSSLVDAFKGPIAIAFGRGNVTDSAKALFEYIRTSKSTLNVIGGFIGNRRLSAEDLKSLATLPPREVLVAQIIGGLQGPILVLLSYLTAPLSNIVGILQARMQQLEAK